MKLDELQAWVEDDWKNGNRERPSVELQLLYIIEEMGEVAEAIRKYNNAKPRTEKVVDLGSELADLVISVVTLSNHFKIDLTQEIIHFQERMNLRHIHGL